MRRCGVATGLLLCWCAAAAAQTSAPQSVEAQAKAHFQLALGHYNLGHYPEAAAEFQAGYALSPKPAFLLNLGQTYRAMNDVDRAREMYARYLEAVPAGDPHREQVVRVLAALDAQPRRPPPPEAPRPPPQVGQAPAQPAPALTQPAPAVEVHAAPRMRRRTKALIWTGAIVGTLLVGGAIALGVVLGTTPVDPKAGLGSAPAR